MIKFIKIKKLLSKITFTHLLLAIIALILFFGFYYSSTEFRSKVYILRYRIQYFGYGANYHKVGETVYKCKYGSIEQSEYDKRVSYLNEEIIKQEAVRKQNLEPHTLNNLRKYDAPQRELDKIKNENKREVEERYGVVIETKSRFGIPFRKNYFYIANNATSVKNIFKDVSSNCECQKGFNKNNICKWISYSEPIELK